MTDVLRNCQPDPELVKAATAECGPLPGEQTVWAESWRSYLERLREVYRRLHAEKYGEQWE